MAQNRSRWGALFVLVGLLLSSACQIFSPVTRSGPGETGEPARWTGDAELPAPRLLERTPAPGAEQPLEAPLTFTFDQPMDRPSVESAFAISPTVQGQLRWTDERTLVFAPEAPLARGTDYTVALAPEARSARGKALAEPLAFRFATVGYLEVGEVHPAPEAKDLPPDSNVTVVFNRPVVPLNPVDRQGVLPNPLVFSPTVEGRGEWVNTSIYVFRPAAGFVPATRYTVRVTAGLTDTTGGVLAEDFTWDFSTLRPQVLSSLPENGAEDIAPGEVISLTFNQPMDHSSTERAFVMMLGTDPLTGTFRWVGGEKPQDPETLVFEPSRPLARDLSAAVTVGAEARARNGNVTMPQAFRARFLTLRTPGLVSSSPADGAEKVDPESLSLALSFASPMDTKAFTRHLTLTPSPAELDFYWRNNDREVSIYFEARPDTAYRIALDAMTPDRSGALLGNPATVRFTTGDLPPRVYVNSRSDPGIFSAYTDTVIYASAMNVSELELRLYQVPLRDFFNIYGKPGGKPFLEFYEADSDDLIRKWSQAVPAARNREQQVALAMLDDEGAALPPGVYMLRVTAPETQALEGDHKIEYFFVKSRLNLTLKQSLDEVLIWATDLADGTPQKGLSIQLGRETGMGEMGTTDADGIYQGGWDSSESIWDPLLVVSGEPGEEDFGVTLNQWTWGLEAWDFDLPAEYYSTDYRAALYTDRPIYRPGQTVYFKGIVRADDDAHYRIPKGLESVRVAVQDPQGKMIYSETLALNEMGSLFGELELDGEAPLGWYQVLLKNDDELDLTSVGFQVAEYRKPEFQIAVTTDQPAYLAGDTIAVSAEATYYFGGPVADAGVKWNILRAPYAFDYPCPQGQACPWYDWTDESDVEDSGAVDYGGYGQLIASGEAQTDAQGRVTFAVPAELGEEIRSQQLTIEVNVTDINAQAVSQRTGVVVHPGDFYLGAAPRGYLAEVGEEKSVDLLAVSAPLGAESPSAPVPDLSLEAVFMEHRWYNVQRQAEDGRYYWTWEVEDIPVLTQTVTTGPDGKAVAAFTPSKAGAYRVRVSGRDAQGRGVSTSTYLWVWGGDAGVSWRQQSDNRMMLVPDKREYQVGDVAKILVPSPFSGAVRALVTIERGRVLEHQVEILEGNRAVVEIPIRDDYHPNVFVSVLLIQGSAQAPDGIAGFKMGLINLPISLEEKTLQIALTPDKDPAAGEHYGPRQKATYRVQVTDSEGNPVEAELSLRLADLAVLALADERGPNLLETFWSRRGLGARTALGLVVAMEAYNRDIAEEAKGGGGGDGAGQGLVRTNFVDTAFWDPVVRTDEDGRAEVTVTLPDNLTTWRMQAKGITADTRVGRSDVDVVSTLDLLVRPVLPRFFVVGDRAMVATVVHNNTAQARAVTTAFEGEGLVLEGADRQTVNVPAAGKAEVFWPVTVQDVNEVRVKMESWTDGEGAARLSDAREDRLPVYRYSTPEVVATAGRLSEPGAQMELLSLPQPLDPTRGELEVRLEGSLTAATKDALGYLEHYPYECTEQTVSRFLPNVVTYQVLQELQPDDAKTADLRARLTAQVQTGLQRLYANQHYDGGWGWWAADESQGMMTAYVLQGLLEAKRAGFVVDETVIDRAVVYLREHLDSPAQLRGRWQGNRLAYQLYVLAEYSRQSEAPSNGILGLGVTLFEQRERLDYYGKALLAQALALLEPEEPARVQTLLDELAGGVKLGATGAHWEEPELDIYNMNSDIRTTAIIVRTLARLKPKSDLLPHAVRWLMAVRREGIWESTQSTAWSLMALAAYMRTSEDLLGEFDYTLALNERVVTEGTIDRRTLDEPEILTVAVADLLADEANRLVIEREAGRVGQSGRGQLYYEVALRTYRSAEAVPELNRGIIVSRQYNRIGDPETSITTAVVGDVIQVRLTIVAPTDLHYVIVEDPLPAGCEAIDMSLKTTSVVGQAPEVTRGGTEDWERSGHGWGWWWFSHVEQRDEKTALFSTYLPRGTYEYTYLIRASVSGEFRVLPAVASEMYFPEVFGRSAGTLFTVQP